MAADTTPFFEEVAIGLEIPSLMLGPMTNAIIMRWSASMENWHRIHYDHDFAVAHDKLPGVLVSGSSKQQFVMSMLKDWAGLSGWVWKVAFQFRAMNLAGEELIVWGRVVGKRPLANYGLVDLEIGIRNEKGKESTPGSAVVVLPYRDGAPLPYPFTPPSL